MTALGLHRRCLFDSRPLLIVVCAVAPAVFAQDVLRNSSRECAICHVRWIDALERDESQKQAMATFVEREAGSGDMCLSCHDGSVVDSRFKVWGTRHHSTDVVPSPAVKIPQEKFPLDPQGRMTCATCHTAHAVPNSSDIRTVVFLREPNINSSFCLACHPEHAQKNEFQHPLGHTDEPVPQNILKAGGKTSEDGHEVFCQTCHTPHGTRNAWMLVLPPSELCISCHTERAPDAKAPAGAPIHRIGQTYPEFEPPASLLEEKATFGPNGELDCLSCHRLHDASGAVPLLIQGNQNGALCLACHDKEKAVIDSPHDLRLSAPKAVNAEGQRPAESGVCGTCHRIHGWARNVRDTQIPHSSACIDCHETGGPGAENRPYHAAHPMGVAVPADVNPSLPLDQATRQIGCLTCHDPHTPLASQTSPGCPPGDTSADNAGGTVSTSSTASAIRPPRSFLRRQGSQLCVLCHGDIADSLAGPHDPNEFAPETRDKLGIYASIGACRVCHTSHDAKGPYLWRQAVAASDSGAPVDLCGACHNSDLFSRTHITRHPTAVVGPQEAPEDPNQAPGADSPPLIACIGCHNPHDGQDPSRLLRRPPDQLCTWCHPEKEGIKNSVHDPATSQWAKDLGFIAEGSCFDCHVIHDPNDKDNISRLLPATADSDNLCQACHQAGAPGQPADSVHMGKKPDTDPNSCTFSLPLGQDKRIRCFTCHDIHRQSPEPTLLRASIEDSALCLACHTDSAGLLYSPHDLRTSAPGRSNLRGQVPARSGPCGVCHLMHATPAECTHAAEGQDAASVLCIACHSAADGAIAAIPQYIDHPDVSMFNRTSPQQPQYMPLFDKQGEPSPSGGVSCPTCHDPHAVPLGDAAAAGGITRRIFLRPGTRQRLCADCHGKEALWRFLYYHKETRIPPAIKLEKNSAANPGGVE